MIEPFEAAYEVCSFLASHKIQHVVIGGLAVQIWGESRFTKDADISIASPTHAKPRFSSYSYHQKFRSRAQDPLALAQSTRMVLITAGNGVEVDISLSLPGYEDSLFARAVEYEIESGKIIRLCSAEDLIIHKAVAGRPQDIIDIQGVVDRQGDKLDVRYIRQWLKEFSDALETEEVIERFETLWRKK